MKGYTYILLCNDDSYYTGSTKNLERRLQEHFSGVGANHTKKHPPVKLVYYEEFQRIDEAFYREKQIQGWNRKKKEALINGKSNMLPELSLAYRDLKSGLREPQPAEKPVAEALQPVAEALEATGEPPISSPQPKKMNN